MWQSWYTSLQRRFRLDVVMYWCQAYKPGHWHWIVDERKYDRLIKYNTGGNRALYIVVCMRSASRYVKMVVVKQGTEVHWWNDNDDKELESTIQIWVADNAKVSRRKDCYEKQ